jgi:hypothetical protein
MNELLGKWIIFLKHTSIKGKNKKETIIKTLHVFLVNSTIFFL